MEDNGNHPTIKIVSPEAQRVRASGPILILAFLFVGGAFLTWYFTWFGRGLSDADISQYLVDEKHPRHVQHALLQIQQRIEKKDANAKQWYPQIVSMAHHQETEFRLTVAWIMGFDNQSPEFHRALLELTKDQEPIVRRNAALALVRFGDPNGRSELASILSPYQVNSPAAGEVDSTLKEGSTLARGTLLGRIMQPGSSVVEVRAPLPGKIAGISPPSGSTVSAGAPLVSINADEDSVWEALRGLSLIGSLEDVPAVERFAQDATQSERIRKQAALTANAIKGRADSNKTN
jgi:HEAT repeats